MNKKILVITSDFHGHYKEVTIPHGDFFIGCGDFSSGHSDITDTVRFACWLENLPHKHKVVIAGNHDFCTLADSLTKSIFSERGIVYLNCKSVTLDGVKFWGGPWTPQFGAWAYMLPPERLEPIWDTIPEDTDVVITHGPPYKILDTTKRKVNAGCPYLAKRMAIVQPKIHCFGHIHEDRGTLKENGTPYENGTLYVNAAICDVKNRIANPPTIIISDF
jgi:Icc-related predicted phosphoesterase